MTKRAEAREIAKDEVRDAYRRAYVEMRASKEAAEALGNAEQA